MVVFGGDLAIAKDDIAQSFFSSLDNLHLLSGKTFVLNLEGVIKEEDVNIFPMYKLHNIKAVTELKKTCQKLVYSLANNHVFDYPEKISYTRKLLDEEYIAHFGTIENDTIKPAVFDINGLTYAVFGHCWNLYTRTNSNKVNQERIVDCSYSSFYSLVKMYINNHPSQRVVCYMHWNFDLEEFPFPAYVALSHSLIDAGVYSVIGNHSHNIQPIEVYNGHLIAYGLGNFNIVNDLFFGGRLSFPDDSRNSLLVELTNNSLAKLFLCETSRDGKAITCKKEIAIDLTSKNTMYYPTIEGVKPIDYDNYSVFFKKNRKKNTLTPIFYSFKDSLCNRLKMDFLVKKVKAIRFVNRHICKLK